MMKVRILDGCIGCGLCVSTCPEVFEMGPEQTAQVAKQPEGPQMPCVKTAAENCPVSVIDLTE